jgi:hypothetical protein
MPCPQIQPNKKKAQEAACTFKNLNDTYYFRNTEKLTARCLDYTTT